MTTLHKYTEELHLGVVDDPHHEQPALLTERVTVCPSCYNLRSLRQGDEAVHCIECLWSNPPRVTPTVAA